MITANIVSLSDTNNYHRIDPDFYRPEFIDVETKIKKQNVKLWGKLGGFFLTGPFGSEFKVENYVRDSKYRYVRGKDVKEFFLQDDDNVYIPEKDFLRLKKYSLSEGHILISVVGTLGNTAVVDKTVPPAIFSCKSTAYVPGNIEPFYLIAYLNCKYGRLLLERRVRGAVQTGLNIGDLRSLPIFYPNNKFQRKTAELVISSKENLDKSVSFYSQAQNLILSELGLQNFRLKDNLSYDVGLSETSTVRRIDAEYFNPSYVELIERISRKCEMKLLNKVIMSFKKGVEVGGEKYKNEGFPFIRVSSISKEGLVDKDQKYISEEDYLQLKNKFEPKEGEILLTKDATPGLAYHVKEPIKGIVSSGIIRLSVKDINPEYLCLCINTLIGQFQIERDGGGSVITHWKPSQIKKLQIPILPKSFQDKIAVLVQQSHEAQIQGKLLLEKAKKMVEDEIEKAK